MDVKTLEEQVAIAQATYNKAVEIVNELPNFRGRFSEEEMLKLQKYYGRNIRRNVGNLEEMIRDCWACFYHSCSNDADPQHDYCPLGPDTWCSYHRAALHGESDLSHSSPPLIPPDLAPAIKGVWEKLCDPDLLSRCVLGGTQNQERIIQYVDMEQMFQDRLQFTSFSTGGCVLSNTDLQ